MVTRALIVDDSKSARAFLSRMLEKHGLGVDCAESAEQALDYLAANRPDVIFMDHQMPGMDGLQAVRAIKDNPRTATIPIMMYTSQEGELYLSQARALGAVGVLPKQIKPADVSKVLYQLHLVADRRSSAQSSFRPVTVTADGLAAAAPELRGAEGQSPGRPLTDASLRSHLADLRRALIAGLDQHSERVVFDVHQLLQGEQPAMVAGAAMRPRWRRWLPWGMAAAAAAAAIALGILAWQQSVQRQLLVEEVAQLSQAALTTDQLAALATARRPPAPATPPASTGVVPGTGAGTGAAAGPDADSSDGTPAEAKPIVEAVPYGAEPFSGARLDALRQLFDRLAAQDFHGTVDIRLFSGRFCLIGNATDGYSLAPDDIPYARCDTIAGTRDDGSAQPARVPVTVADLIDSLRMTTHDAVHVQIAAGDSSSATAYPPVGDALTAGEWNRAAGANNRIEIRLRRS